jgi:predicted PurR-regulated permease PerM
MADKSAGDGALQAPRMSLRSDIPVAEPVPVPAAVTAQVEREPASRSFVAILLGATALTAYLVQPFWAGLFLAAVLAMALYPAHLWLTARLGNRQRLAGSFLTLGLLGFIVAPLASTTVVAVREIIAGLQWARDSLGIGSLGDLPNVKLPPNVEVMLTRLLETLHMTRTDLQEYAGRALSLVQQVAPSALGASFGALGAMAFVLVAYFFFTVDGSRVVDFMCVVSPLRRNQTEELLQEFRSVSSAALLGTVVTSLIIAGLVTIGFVAVGIPHAIFFGIITVVSGFIPVVGSAVVFVPAVAYLLLASRIGAGIGLAVWCSLGVGVADNVIKPLLMRGHSEMHVGLMFLSLLGGLAIFGGIGILAGPVIMAFFLAIWRMYARDYTAE